MLLTRSPLIHPASWASAFDLHVLSTPPAFVLSQDQTLRTKTKTLKPRKTNQTQRSASNPNQKHSKTKNRHKTKTNKHTIEFTNNTHTTKNTQQARFRQAPNTTKPSNKLSSPPLGDRRIIYTPPTPKSNQTTMTPNTHPTNPHNTTKNHPTTPTHHNKKADPTTPQQRNQARQTPQKETQLTPISG